MAPHRCSQKRKHQDCFPVCAKLDGYKILFSPGPLYEENQSDIREFESHLLSVIKKRKSTPKYQIRYRQLCRKQIYAFILHFKNPRLSAKIQNSQLWLRFSRTRSRTSSILLRDPGARKSQKGIVIGPKGSGKSSILRALASHNIAGQAIEITPEVFATSMLKNYC